MEGGVHYNGIAKDQKISNITGGGKKIPILDTKGNGTMCECGLNVRI